MGKLSHAEIVAKATGRATDKSSSALEFDAAKVAHQVDEIADAIAILRRYFKDKLIVLLLNDVTGVAKRDIQAVIDALPTLATVYLKPRKS